MSTFPQPGELESMAADVVPPLSDLCSILTYGETFDLDGAPLVVYSEGDLIPCTWEQTTTRSETPAAAYTTSVNQWTVSFSSDYAVTRRDMLKLYARKGVRLPVPAVGEVYGDPVPDVGLWTVTVREIAQ